MWPGIKNSLGIKIHQNHAVQSKYPGRLDKQIKRAELKSATVFFPNSLAFYEISSLSQKLRLQQNISQYL